MKVKTMVAAATLAATFAAGAADMASQKWVEMKLAELKAEIDAGAGGISREWVNNAISNAISSVISNTPATLAAQVTDTYANGVLTLALNSGDIAASVSIEDSSVYALQADETTPSANQYGITNGFIFVWNGNAYANGSEEIAPGTNCFIWHGIESERMDGLDVFTNGFSVVGLMLQPSVAAAITNAARSANWNAPGGGVFRRMATMAEKALSTLCGMVFGTAYAANGGGMNFLPQRYITNEKYANVHFVYEKKSYDFPLRIKSDGSFNSYDLSEFYKKIFGEDQPPSFDVVAALEALRVATATRLALFDLAKKIQSLYDAELEIADDATGETTTATPAPTPPEIQTEIQTRIFHTQNIINRVVDDKSISTNAIGALQLKNYPHGNGDAGKIPFYDSDFSLGWFFLLDLLDGNTITGKCDYGSSAISQGGISLAGWDNPTGNAHVCSDSIADILTGKKSNESHYVLTRYNEGGGTLHYTEIGRIESGNAIRIVGTSGGEGLVLGTGATTNTLKFTSKPDSNIRVDVKPYNDDGVELEIGVYYL